MNDTTIDFNTMSPQEHADFDLGYEHGIEAEDALDDETHFYCAGYDHGVADRLAGRHMIDAAPPADRSKYKSPETKNPFCWD